ncbi:MAG: tRNA ((37)-N6)-threonylcarbamoyltransferase complex ATPase subunit type 1 TsaE [Fibrobacteres bacterium]|nr:tRNA ((37)-N6)-threonylcarbamoyltransferase complex ATPase subunit type 1 TsaE [Fibrobacterota bacterium]
MPQPIEEFRSASEAETLAWAEKFAARLRAGDTVALSGNLGAGKTVLSRGISRGLGFAGDVHSPSYALIHEYTGARLPLFHMDLYRLAEGADWEEIGLDHYFQQGGICLVEWAERLPAGQSFSYRIELIIEGGDTRRIRVIAG